MLFSRDMCTLCTPIPVHGSGGFLIFRAELLVLMGRTLAQPLCTAQGPACYLQLLLWLRHLVQLAAQLENLLLFP